jgi:hypothetical protein
VAQNKSTKSIESFLADINEASKDECDASGPRKLVRGTRSFKNLLSSCAAIETIAIHRMP